MADRTIATSKDAQLEALTDYALLRGNPEHVPESALNLILRRYASVWQAESAFRGQQPRRVSRAVPISPAPGLGIRKARTEYLSFLQPEGKGPWMCLRQLAFRPDLMRLNYIRQLSTTSILLNLEATHNRLSHLLGTLDMASYMLQVLSDTVPEEALSDGFTAAATLLYAFLHDAYHGPLGHSLDRATDVSGERLDKYLFGQQLERDTQTQSGPLWELAEALAVWIAGNLPQTWRLRTRNSGQQDWLNVTNTTVQLLAFLKAFPNRRVLEHWYGERLWLRDIVDSALDADRFDYLLRDSRGLGADITGYVCETGAEPTTSVLKAVEMVTHMVGRARVLRAPNSDGRSSQSDRPIPTAAAGRVPYRIVWHVDDWPSIQRLWAKRTWLYDHVYEAADKREHDDKVAHMLRWIAREEGMEEELGTFFTLLSRLTDDELFHLFYELGAYRQYALVVALAHELRRGDVFTQVWRRGVLSNSLSLLRDVRDQETLSAAADTSCEPFVGVEHRRFDGDEHDRLLVQLQQRCGRSFGRREQLELLLWVYVCDAAAKEGFAEALDEALRGIVRRVCWGGPVSIPPLLFLSVPWIGKRGPGIARREWREYEEVFVHDGRNLVAIPDDRISVDVYPAQEVVVFLPPALAEIAGVRRVLNDGIWKMLYSRVWMLDKPGGDQTWRETNIPDDCRRLGVVED